MVAENVKLKLREDVLSKQVAELQSVAEEKERLVPEYASKLSALEQQLKSDCEAAKKKAEVNSRLDYLFDSFDV